MRHDDIAQDAASFGPRDLVAIRRNPIMTAVAAFPWVLTVALVILGLLVNPVLLAFTQLLGLVAIFAGGWVWHRNPWPIEERVAVSADKDGLTMDGQRLPRRQLVAGAVLPGKQPRVRLPRRWAPAIELQVRDVAEGRALLRALGLDASQVAGVFRTGSRTFADANRTTGLVLTAAVVITTVLWGTAMLHRPALVLMALFLVLATVISVVTAMLVPTTTRVGADGIALSWLGGRRFIGYGEVESVERDAVAGEYLAVNLTLRSGEVLRLPVVTTDEKAANLLCERICEAMESWSSGGTEPTAMLRRQGRDVPAWITALRALGAGANADMRTPPVPRDRLFRIVESPAAGAAVRAAAATALGGDALSDEDRARLRGAARAVAAPKLRFAIEAAAGGSEEEIAAALAEMEDEANAPKVRAARG